MASDAEDVVNEEVRETESFISDEEVTLFDSSSRNRCLSLQWLRAGQAPHNMASSRLTAGV